jgi:pyrimidine operon attenuation protein/uracil phosphoribosyltransferase
MIFAFVHLRPIMPTKIPPAGIEDRDVILIDDVLYSGRTIRSALDALGEIGRPRTVQLAALCRSWTSATTH